MLLVVAAVAALAVLGAGIFVAVRWWEGSQAAGAPELVAIPLGHFDPSPTSLSRVADLPGGPALIGSAGCRRAAPDAPCVPGLHVWTEEQDDRWTGHRLDLPRDVVGQVPIVSSASDGRLLLVDQAHRDGGFFGLQVPVVWRGESVETLVVEQLPASMGEVVCERAGRPRDGRCPDVDVRAAGESTRGSLLVTQQGSGLGTIGVYRRDESVWRSLPAPDQLLTVEAAATSGGRLLVAGLVCPSCPDRRDAQRGLLATDDGTTWDRVGADVLPSVPTAGLAGSRDGIVAALLVGDDRCRLAHSRDGRGWRLLPGDRTCHGHLELATSGDVIALADPRGSALEVLDVGGRHITTVRLPGGARVSRIAGSAGRVVVVAHGEGPAPLVFVLTVDGPA